MSAFVGYGPNGEYRVPTGPVSWSGAAPAAEAIELQYAPRIFSFGYGLIPQVAIDNDEAIVSVVLGGTY